MNLYTINTTRFGGNDGGNYLPCFQCTGLIVKVAFLTAICFSVALACFLFGDIHQRGTFCIERSFASTSTSQLISFSRYFTYSHCKYKTNYV